MLTTNQVIPWVEKVIGHPELISSVMQVFRGYDIKAVHNFIDKGPEGLFFAKHLGFEKSRQEIVRLISNKDVYHIIPDRLDQEYLDETKVANLYSGTAEIFDSIADKYFPPVPRGQAQNWLNIASTDRVLEIAVATGANLASYPACKEIVGIDISKKSLEIAKLRVNKLNNNIEVLFMNAEQTTFESESFDKILVLCGLCAAKSPFRIVHEAYRILRKGGTFVLYEPSISYNDKLDTLLFLLQPIGREIGAIWFDDFPPYVIPYNTYWDLISILESANLRILQECFFDPPYNTLRMIKCEK